MIENRMYTITALGGGLLSVLLVFVSGQVLFALLASLFFAISVLVWKYGYILMPFFTSAAKIVEVRGGYTIPPTRDCIIKASRRRRLLFLKVPRNPLLRKHDRQEFRRQNIHGGIF